LLAVGLPDHIVVRVIDILWPPDSDSLRNQPDFVLFKPGDLERYADGDLLGFLLKLDEQQQKFTDWALGGPTLLKGGPGSGKSTVALYRVRALVEQAVRAGAPVPHILFTTFTNPLISFSESLLCQLLADVIPLPSGRLPKEITIRTVDSLAMTIAARGESRPIMPANQKSKMDALGAARSRLLPKGFGDSARLITSSALQDLHDEYLLAEFEWVIEGQSCDGEEDYLRASRRFG